MNGRRSVSADTPRADRRPRWPLSPPLPDFGPTGGIAFLATSVVEGSRDDSIVSGCKLNFSFRWWSPDWGARVLELTLVNVSFVPFCRPRMDVLSLFQRLKSISTVPKSTLPSIAPLLYVSRDIEEERNPYRSYYFHISLYHIALYISKTRNSVHIPRGEQYRESSLAFKLTLNEWKQRPLENRR